MQEFGIIEQAEGQPQLSRYLPVEHHQARAVGEFDDRLVEHHVRGADCDPILGLTRSHARFHGFAHMQCSRVQRITLRDGLAFDKTAHTIDVNDRGHIRLRHGHPSIGFMLEQPLPRQDPERFPQGVA
ncbi:hypothetical protein D3C84_440910 [compost metagenome]